MKAFIVAIDGPVGSGKSSVARMVAKVNQMAHIDTGAIYRSIAWFVKQQHVDVQNEQMVTSLAKQVKIEVTPSPEGSAFVVEGQDITKLIRTEEISRMASIISQYKGVRAALLELQRQLGYGASLGAVLEGRDIQTVVFPDANIKVFLTATEEERAKRRFLELKSKGEDVSYDAVLDDLKVRDARDRSRAIAPLQAAPDAVVLDSTSLSQEEVVEAISQLIRQAKKQTR